MRYLQAGYDVLVATYPGTIGADERVRLALRSGGASTLERHVAETISYAREVRLKYPAVLAHGESFGGSILPLFMNHTSDIDFIVGISPVHELKKCDLTGSTPFCGDGQNSFYNFFFGENFRQFNEDLSRFWSGVKGKGNAVLYFGADDELVDFHDFKDIGASGHATVIVVPGDHGIAKSRRLWDDLLSRVPRER
jgi:hypothetical protein